MHSKPIRDDAGNRLFDAVYNSDGTVAIEVKNAKQKLRIDLINVLKQVEQGKRSAADEERKPKTK